jgi:hypothetical protein
MARALGKAPAEDQAPSRHGVHGDEQPA